MMKLTMKTMALAFAATLALTAVSCSDEDF
jgi:hypothetical protein